MKKMICPLPLGERGRVRGNSALVVILLLPLLLACQGRGPDLPVLGALPDFQLTTQDNQSFSARDLRGKVVVANFIFTSCAGTCPLLTQRMKGVQDHLEEMSEKTPSPPAKIVSFSVDPERDTPARLADYAKTYGADHQLWVFLTGPLDQVTQTVVKGFKISMGKVPVDAPEKKISDDEIFEVVHGEKFVLIDSQGRIRGYYDSDRAGIKQLIRDMESLLRQVAS